MCRLLGAFAKFSIESKTWRERTKEWKYWGKRGHLPISWTSKKCKLTLTEEDQDGAGPLQSAHGVAKQKNWAEDGEELPCGCDDGAGQRSKVDHSQENEGLVRTCKARSVGRAGSQQGSVRLRSSHPPVLKHWSPRTAGCCRWCSGNVQWSSGTPRVHLSTGWLTAEQMKAWRNKKEKIITIKKKLGFFNVRLLRPTTADLSVLIGPPSGKTPQQHVSCQPVRAGIGEYFSILRKAQNQRAHFLWSRRVCPWARMCSSQMKTEGVFSWNGNELYFLEIYSIVSCVK